MTGDLVRRKLPRVRTGSTIAFTIGEAKGYVTTGVRTLEDGKTELGEIFLKVAKQGSTLSGVMDALAIVISIALQYGVPLEAIVSQLIGLRFEPSGKTNDEEIPEATSIIDYVSRRIGGDFLDDEAKRRVGIHRSDQGLEP